SHTFRSGGAGGGGFEDILNSMFGAAGRGARPGGGGGGGSRFEFDPGTMALDLDISVSMTVSLEEAVNGAEKRVRLPSGKELNVKIPAGVVAGQQIRLKGQGESAAGHPPGDLLITVSIAQHPLFKVDGSDLRLDLPITLYEAVLGGKVRVPTLGSAVELSIPKNTSSGRTFRLKGKGLPKAGGNGDLLVTTRIMLPDGNNAELEALMQKWRDAHPYNPRSDFS
ncbi:MAG: J domain-containing protein, partial [Bradyrhizobium sp.]